jgi:hypothetical protein
MPRLTNCSLATRKSLAPILHGLPSLHVRGQFLSRQSGNFGGLGAAMRAETRSPSNACYTCQILCPVTSESSFCADAKNAASRLKGSGLNEGWAH